MVRVGRHLKDYLVPAPPPWAGTPSTRPGCSELHPTWPWTLPGSGQPQIIVNIGEHVLLLPVGLNHLIESHSPTKMQIKRPNTMYSTRDLTTLAASIGQETRGQKWVSQFEAWEMPCAWFIKDWRELSWPLAIATSKGEVSVRAGFWTWMSKVQHYSVAANLKLAKNKLEC